MMFRYKTLEMGMFPVLETLVNWTNDGTYTHASDLFQRARGVSSSQLIYMLRVGYVEYKVYSDCSNDKWWRITDKGRAAYNAIVFANAFKNEWDWQGKAPLAEKFCPGCHQIKPIFDFGRDRCAASGVKSRCRTCKSLQRKRDAAARHSELREAA